VPLSLALALFLVELAPPRLSRVVSTIIELLAAIPSIIYGMWGMFIFAPFMANYVQPALGETLGWLPLFQGPLMGLGMLTAGVILAFMVLPFICAITRDVFSLVPSVVKEAAFGMGATGLDLAIVKHIAPALGGRVTVDRTPGQGSTFSLHLSMD